MNKETKEQIEELKQEIEELEERKDSIENNECYDEYDDMIDDTHEVVKIGTLSYNPSQVLKQVDEIAYTCGYNDYFDEEISDIENQISDKKEEIKRTKQHMPIIKRQIMKMMKKNPEKEFVFYFTSKTNRYEIGLRGLNSWQVIRMMSQAFANLLMDEYNQTRKEGEDPINLLQARDMLREGFNVLLGNDPLNPTPDNSNTDTKKPVDG